MRSKTRAFCDGFRGFLFLSIPRIYIWNAWLFSSMLSSYLAYHQLFIITLAVREIDLHSPFRLCCVPQSLLDSVDFYLL